MTDKPTVFISYCREPSGRTADWVSKIERQLESNGIDAWRDIEVMEPGVPFDRAISEAIRDSKVVLCVVTPKYFKSSWCNHELRSSFSLRKPIIPILLQNTDVPPPLSFINSLDFQDVDPGDEEELESKTRLLIQAIERLADDDASCSKAESPYEAAQEAE